MKTCTKCKETKPLDGFSPPLKGRYHSHCKRCRADGALRRYHADPDYRARQRAHQMTEHGKAVKRRARRNRPEKALWSGARQRAVRKDIPFNITTADIDIPIFCPCCTIEMVTAVGMARPDSLTLDRIQNHLGYVQGNVWVICRRCNAMKGDSAPFELRRIADAVERKVRHARKIAA